MRCSYCKIREGRSIPGPCVGGSLLKRRPCYRCDVCAAEHERVDAENNWNRLERRYKLALARGLRAAGMTYENAMLAVGINPEE